MRRKIHYAMGIFWIIMVPVTLIWLKDAIWWVALMSLYANIEASFSAAEASKKGGAKNE